MLVNPVRAQTNLLPQPQQAPMIPPRTYPQPPPSNLPNLLLGIYRLFSWLAGGSATLIFIYYVRPFWQSDAHIRLIRKTL